MDDDAQLARDLLLARRLKLAVRLVIYPLLLGALVLALHIRHAQADDDAPKGPQRVLRVFSGDRAFAQTEDDQLVWLQLPVRLTCDNGKSFTWRLSFGRSDIQQTGDRARALIPAEEGHADDGAPVSYGAVTASVAVGVAQLNARVSTSLRWTYRPGTVTTCSSVSVLQTLAATGA
jgi:hypothetical protein